jgi:hypothetical protein
MNGRLRFAIAAAGISAGMALAGVSVSAADSGPGSGWGSPNLVFAQTNAVSGNQIVVYLQTGGGLTFAGRYLTGGTGATASGAVVDTLASQGSLVYDAAQRVLINVNAGSDSISVFGVIGNRLYLRQVLPSGGVFPDSVGVSGDLVYVLNAGGGGALQGYQFEGGWLSPIPGSSRSLGLMNSDPPNYLDSPGQVGFSPSGRQLLVTTKASGSDIDVFQVERNGDLSASPVVNPSAQPVPFGFTFDNFGRLVVTEAGTSSVTTYSLAPDGSLNSIASLGDGEAALCWITQADGYFYGANAGSNTLSGYRVGFNGSLSLLGDRGGIVATTGAGPIDLAAADGYLYSQAGGAGAIEEFRVNWDGSLTEITSVTGLGAGIEGLATS